MLYYFLTIGLTVIVIIVIIKINEAEISDQLDGYEDLGSENVATKRINYVPKYMLDLYEKSRIMTPKDIYLFRNHPEVVKSVIPLNTESIHSEDPSIRTQHFLNFEIPRAQDDEIFEKAELRILTIQDPSMQNPDRIIHISYYDPIEFSRKHLEQKYTTLTNNTWISFNLTSAVNDVTYKNLTLLRIRISIEARLDLDLQEHSYPLLLLFYGTPRIRRFKRDLEEEYEEESNSLWSGESSSPQLKRLRRLRNSCKRSSLYVHFADIHYDSWIVQPEGYEAYQCSGKCFYPVAEHLSPTKHAVIQGLMHSIQAHWAPRTCCVPTKLGSISVLYYDSNDVLTYRYGYQDMVVLECGCR